MMTTRIDLMHKTCNINNKKNNKSPDFRKEWSHYLHRKRRKQFKSNNNHPPLAVKATNKVAANQTQFSKHLKAKSLNGVEDVNS